jgi:hypothetical protein
MAYVPLDLPTPLPTYVELVIRGPVEGYLHDVHWMLATTLPSRPDGPGRQLQNPIALTLLAIVAGVSTELYQPPEGADTGRRFKDCLVEFFPWDVDPPTGVSNEEAAKILYDSFRNPMVHFLGIWNPVTTKLGSVFRGSDDAEAEVEKLERLNVKPFSDPCLVVTDEKRVLWLDQLYWGVRQMIQRWARDPDQVARAHARIQRKSAVLRPD